MKKKKSIISKIAYLAMLALLTLGTAFAEDEMTAVEEAASGVVEMPGLSESPKSLTITYTYAGHGVAGVRLAIYRIANVTVTRGRVDYTLTEEFKAYPVDFEAMTTASSIAYAASVSTAGKTAEQTGMTDEEGRVVFADLEPGMYLIVQTEATGAAAAYEKTEPYLLAVPQADTEDGVWIDAVTAYPKTEMHAAPDTPTPVTGDHSPIFWLVVIGAADVVFFIGAGLWIAWRRRRETV